MDETILFNAHGSSRLSDSSAGGSRQAEQPMEHCLLCQVMVQQIRRAFTPHLGK